MFLQTAPSASLRANLPLCFGHTDCSAVKKPAQFDENFSQADAMELFAMAKRAKRQTLGQWWNYGRKIRRERQSFRGLTKDVSLAVRLFRFKDSLFCLSLLRNMLKSQEHRLSFQRVAGKSKWRQILITQNLAQPSQPLVLQLTNKSIEQGTATYGLLGTVFIPAFAAMAETLKIPARFWPDFLLPPKSVND
jgi:hypothetical protein